MHISWKQRVYDFSPWRPQRGRVFARTFAFDCETTAIDKARPWLVPTYVIGAAFDGRTGVFVTREHLAAFFQVHQDLPFAAHHAPFDIRVIRAAARGLDIDGWLDRRRVWCTRLLYQLLVLGTAGRTPDGKGRTTLERLARRFLGVTLSKNVRDSNGRRVRVSYGRWLGQPPGQIERVYLEYLAKDVIATHQLYIQLRHRLLRLQERSSATWGFVSHDWLDSQARRWGPQTHHIQLRAAVALAEVSERGLHIDLQRRSDLASALEVERDRRKADLATHGYLPGKGSSKALQAILSRIERNQPGRPLPRTPKGKYSAKAAELRDLAAEVPFVDVFLKFHSVQKLLASFMNKLAKPTVHPSFRTMTRTGRTSSFGEINAQNLPCDGRVRDCFIPTSGYTFVTADYSTIELATLAQACTRQFGLESQMAESIKAGRDLHTMVAAHVTSKLESEVTADERRKAKPINFGKPGGMGPATLRATAKNSYGLDLSESEVQSLSDSWFEIFPEMRAFLNDDREQQWARVAMLLGLSAYAHADATGSTKYSRHAQREGRLYDANPYLGAMALKVAGRLNPCKLDGEPYSDEDVGFFWSRIETVRDQLPAMAQRDIDQRRPCPELRKAILRLADRAGVFTLTDRLRANASYCERHNAVFQGLAADGAKLALWKLHRAGYRVVSFIHDEFLIEIPTSQNPEQHLRRIQHLMIRGMTAVVPDLPISVKAAAGDTWAKPD